MYSLRRSRLAVTTRDVSSDVVACSHIVQFIFFRVPRSPPFPLAAAIFPAGCLRCVRSLNAAVPRFRGGAWNASNRPSVERRLPRRAEAVCPTRPATLLPKRSRCGISYLPGPTASVVEPPLVRLQWSVMIPEELEEPKLKPRRASEWRLKLDLIRPSGSGNRRAVVDRNAATRCGERTIRFHEDVLAWFPPSRS